MGHDENGGVGDTLGLLVQAPCLVKVGVFERKVGLADNQPIARGLCLREPDLGLPPATPAPQLSQIRTLAALSDATQETVEDLLGYSATDLETVFQMFKVDVITKNSSTPPSSRSKGAETRLVVIFNMMR